MNNFLHPVFIAALYFNVTLTASAECITAEKNRFISHPNGTVTDSKTSLMWKQCVQGKTESDCSSGVAMELPWVDALNQARSEVFADFDDWRLPKIDELKSIIDTCSATPAINLIIFPGSDNSGVWSASANLDYATDAWVMDFSNGKPIIASRDSKQQVRLVRNIK